MRRRQKDLGFQQEWCCSCRSWLLIRAGEKWRKSVTEELVGNRSVAWWLRDSGGWLQGGYWGKQLEWDREREHIFNGQGESWLNHWFWKWNIICDDEIQGVAMGVDCSSEGDDWRKDERIRQQRKSKCSLSSWFYNEEHGRITFQKNCSQLPKKDIP